MEDSPGSRLPALGDLGWLHSSEQPDLRARLNCKQGADGDSPPTLPEPVPPTLKQCMRITGELSCTEGVLHKSLLHKAPCTSVLHAPTLDLSLLPCSPCPFFWPLPSSRDTSCKGKSSSTLASDGLEDSHWMLRELKLSNLRPCWS